MSAMLDFGSRDDKSVVQIIVFATLYLFLIFTAQSWIATFNSYYQTYILKKEKPDTIDLFLLSVILTTFLIIVIYLVRPRPALFK